MSKAIVATLFFSLAAACANTGRDAAWSAENEAAYQQCLQDNMAAAVAWEMIEQDCRKAAGGEDSDALPQSID